MKSSLFIAFCFSFLVAVAQNSDYSACSGQVLVSVNTNYKMKFLGHKGEDKTKLFGYLPNENVSRNAIWICYEPQTKGTLKVNCQTSLDSLHFVVFKTDVTDACADIKTKKAAAVFSKINTNCTEFENAQMELTGGFNYAFVFIAKEKIKDSIDFKFEFKPVAENGFELLDTLTLNLVYARDKPVYSLHCVDQNTKKPIKARIVISNALEIEGTYTASDLYLNLTKSVKEATIKIDAEGYMSKDITKKKIIPSNHTIDTLFLEPLKRGTVAKLDEIYFAAGLAIILEESTPKLKRLRDFLVLNPTVSIEIQGHVNDDKGGFFSKRLSKRRALKILKYLVESGIDKTRLSAVGFGNTRPVFKDPKSDEEKEANRRVEILIK